MSHSPCRAASPPALAPGRAAASATAAFLASSGHRASSRARLPASGSVVSARGSAKTAENPLAHHRLVAAIIVTRRDSPSPHHPKNLGGWGRAGGARRRRVRRGCAQAQPRTPPRNWGGVDCRSGMPAAWMARAQAQSVGVLLWGRSGLPRLVCFWGLLPLAVAPPTCRLRPVA